jgi:hypothetical protein
MMDDIIVKTMLFLFFSIYLFQLVMEVVYQNDYDAIEDDDTEDEEDDNEDKDNEDKDNEDKDGEKETIITVAYQDKYLMKIRNVKDKLKQDPLNITHFKNNFVMEYTPLGNVLMYYNDVKECFYYYSDSTIPYRYLEVVARKYVLMNNCVSLYFDMEEELNRREKDKEKDRIHWQQKDLKEDINKQKDLKDFKDLKKSVFAKFKSYNKEGGTGHVNTAAPAKNNISQINVKVNEKEQVLLKERANRYSHQGKILNFSMLQKVDRTKVDRKFAMSYLDFKRLKNMERIYDKEDKKDEDEDEHEDKDEDNE